MAQYWSFSCNNASYKKSEIIFYFHVSSRFSLKTKQFKPLLGLGSYQKKAIADEEKGEAGTWANFSKAASRLGKSVWSPQSDSSWWRWKFAAAKLFAWGIMGMVRRLGGFLFRTCLFFFENNM